MIEFKDCFFINTKHIKFIGERNKENGQYKVTFNDDSEIILDDKYDKLVTEWLQHRVDIVVENERLKAENEKLKSVIIERNSVIREWIHE